MNHPTTPAVKFMWCKRSLSIVKKFLHLQPAVVGMFPQEKELTLLCGEDVDNIYTNNSGGTDNLTLLINEVELISSATTLSSSLAIGRVRSAATATRSACTSTVAEWNPAISTTPLIGCGSLSLSDLIYLLKNLSI